MRNIVFAVVMAAGVSLIGIAAASAVPATNHAMSQVADHSSNITLVAGGCGRGFHRGPRGGCIPN